jgi:predicted nucleotidyltransferase
MDVLVAKQINSSERLENLRTALASIGELTHLPSLTVFVAGSYARKEASIHSDIDLFFVYDGSLTTITNPNIKKLRAFSKIIEEADRLNFPSFSNDGEFLRIIESSDMLKELGGRNDDHLNFFTARMLMLLESVPIHQSHTYDHVLREIVDAYFRDYSHHPKDFRPTFLINDIIRFWKTLCLNYENKRNQPEEDRTRKIKQKIKNFKLKFSRMLTCYGSVAAIINLPTQSGPDEIVKLVSRTPLERLRLAALSREKTRDLYREIVEEYRWFLEVTNVSEDDLIQRFHDKAFRSLAFERAEKFGDRMFTLIHEIAAETGYLRYLVI